MVQKYLSEIFAKFKTGNASERTYYPVLENFLNNSHKEQAKYSVLIESKNSTIGIPDFKIQTEKGLLIGYIEAKDLGRDLNKLSKEEDEQIKKYIKEYPKLLVTNFIEFRLYENHKLVDSVMLTQPISVKLGDFALINEGKFNGLIERFFHTVVSQTYTSKKLSELLAHKTKVLKELILEEINLDDDIVTETERLLETFSKTLNPSITPEKFADMYAQAITFGLFVARINSKEKNFSRLTAYEFIPQTIPLLKKVFWVLQSQDVQQHIKWQVDEIAEILAFTKIEKITEEFFTEGKGRDPIIHFYETFLKEYDSREREKLGVYYTPQPVVSYITRSIHKLLQAKFNKNDGFADSSVIVLDPAAGTLTFPAEAISLAKEEFVKKHGDGGWQNLVKNHILKNFYAFEILMGPYAIGHLKISLLMEELGYKMSEEDRFKLYLTNTLDMEKFHLQTELLAKEISEESEKAYEVKEKTPVMVIMGNPPYSVSSSNIIKEGTGFYKLYESYKEVVRKEEKNIQPLSDDYIKFIAFAHWKIKQTSQGIVGMITNNSYLDGLIHRDMRKKLLEDFDEIYILNLHGNAKRKEITPEGRKDENVFDIQQGVSVVLLVKKEGLVKQIKYYDLWGLREEKYDFLEKNDVNSTDWKNLEIEKFNKDFSSTRWAKKYKNGFLFFSPKTAENVIRYGNCWGLDEVFELFSSGVKTHRDHFVIGFNEKEITQRLQMFLSDLPENFIKESLDLDNTRDWNFDVSRRKVKEQGTCNDLFQDYLWRPFDFRKIYFSNNLIEFPRSEVMQNFLEKENLALCVSRKVDRFEPWNDVIISNLIADVHSSTGQTYVFPLKDYNSKSSVQDELFIDGNKSIYNLTQEFLIFKSNNYKNIEAEEIIYYIYTVLFSNIYREKYKEFLKIDFPRIPFTKDYKLFKQFAQLGEQLVNLHLLKSEGLNYPISKFNGEGEGKIEKLNYDSEAKKVFINEKQYFDNVEPNVWNYYIGGYQVLEKWLKDRKGRILSLEDSLHYRKVITCLSETIDIQKKIDKLYPEVEKDLIS